MENKIFCIFLLACKTLTQFVFIETECFGLSTFADIPYRIFNIKPRTPDTFNWFTENPLPLKNFPIEIPLGQFPPGGFTPENSFVNFHSVNVPQQSHRDCMRSHRIVYTGNGCWSLDSRYRHWILDARFWQQ